MGWIMPDYNDADWNAEQFQLYASHMTEEIEREIHHLDNQIQDSSALTFDDPAVAKKIIEQAELCGRQGFGPKDLTDQLTNVPGDVSKLRGGLLQPRQRAVALEEAKHLSILVDARADATLVLRRYEELWQKAHDAHGIQDATERAAALDQVRNSRRYCDVTREVRSAEQAQRREALQRDEETEREPPSTFGPSSAGAARVPEEILRKNDHQPGQRDLNATRVEPQRGAIQNDDEWWNRDLTEDLDDQRREDDLAEQLRRDRQRER
jgi:hypothetical protein